MMNYTDEQIETAVHAYHWVPKCGTDDVTRMRGALATLTPAEDPDLHHWTPADGPLADALAALPDGHPVTIYGDWGELYGACDTDPYGPSILVSFEGDRDCFGEGSGITSASWLPAAPAWDGALAVADQQGDYWVRGTDGLYRLSSADDSGYTAKELDSHHGPVTIVIDANGHRVGVDQ